MSKNLYEEIKKELERESWTTRLTAPPISKMVEVDVKHGDHHHTEYIDVPGDATYQEIQNEIARNLNNDQIKNILSVRVPNLDAEEGGGSSGSGSGSGSAPGKSGVRFAKGPGSPKVEMGEDGELKVVGVPTRGGIEKVEKEQKDSELGLSDSVLAQKVKSIIEDNRMKRVIPNTKSGKLNTRSLWRAKTGRENLFKKAKERKGKDYHVTIMVDQSGSMTDWAEDAHRACVLAANSLISAGCDVEVFGFYLETEKNEYWFKSAYGEDPLTIDETLSKLPVEKHLRQYLRDNEKHFNSEALLEEMNNTFSGTGNADYESLSYMYRRLAKIDNKEKILLVITDGEPASPNHSFRDPALLRSLITNNKGVKTMALSIGSWHVEDIYPQYAIVNDVDEFNEEFIKLLERNIKRGL